LKFIHQPDGKRQPRQKQWWQLLKGSWCRLEGGE
jgi:hypothetical protein